MCFPAVLHVKIAIAVQSAESVKDKFYETVTMTCLKIVWGWEGVEMGFHLHLQTTMSNRVTKEVPLHCIHCMLLLDFTF